MSISERQGAPAAFVREDADGLRSATLLVDGMHCGGCVQRIEKRLAAVPGVVAARANLTNRRVTVRWRGAGLTPRAFADELKAAGFEAAPFSERAPDDREGKRLLRALAVSGFAAANVMLLSVAVWAGAASDMESVTRAMFHWLSALIVLPAAAYAIGPFARPALKSLRAGAVGMDVPICVAVVLTLAVSLWETARGGGHVFFEAAIMLLFFLLIGRVLDHFARARAGRQAENLMGLARVAAVVLDGDGTARDVAAEDLRPGQRLLVAPGARIAADGVIENGRSDIDAALVTGETTPVSAGPGDRVLAGTLNTSAALTVRVTAAGADTALAELARLMEASLQARSRYSRLADRMARLYAPAVHGAALAAFLGWWALTGVAWQDALLIAVAVLIITCPCALGLAVPVVQVVAHGRLAARGVVLKSGDGLERLAEADTVVFDKTGTLSAGDLVLENEDGISSDVLREAAALAGASRHPLARALVRAVPGVPPAGGVREFPGLGLERGSVRLGSRDWTGAAAAAPEAAGPELWFARPGAPPVRIGFTDALRPDARDVVARLRGMGLAVELLSGDRPGAVAAAARAGGIETWRAGVDPAAKRAHLRGLAARGRKVLMVGDGLNDAPALAEAHVSMSPAAAADVSQAAADLVFQGRALAPVAEAVAVARRAMALARGNFGLAFAYNLIAVPIAVAGWVTPLIAAAAMSASSLVVIANALRLGRPGRGTP